MRRKYLLSGCGVFLSAALAFAQDDGWRPVGGSATPSNGVRLGKPRATKAEVSNPPSEIARPERSQFDSPTLHTVRYAEPIVTTRAQPPAPAPIGVAPGNPEEDFNCGVVTEGTGGPAAPVGTGGFFSGIFSGSLFQGTFQSDHCFDRFISPVSNPFFFEDPRSLTELRPVFIYQHIPGSTPLFHGGSFEGFFLQGRLAFNDIFSIVVHKLGYVAVQPNGHGLPDKLESGSGFAELQLGPKLTFYRNRETNTILAAGVNFELPVGTSKVFQDTGKGAVTPYFSAAQQFGDNWHLMGTTGYRLSFDSERSDSLFSSLHVDYGIYNRIFPLVEVNWYHYTKNGKNLPASFEGEDIINFGSTHVSGNDMVTLAAGVRFKIIPETLQAGVVFEIPISNRRDIMDYRVTADVILRY